LKKTLDRVLSRLGIGSRSDARSWIGAGRVAVNGKVVQTPDQWVDPDVDRVALDGRLVAEQQKLYLLLYKPKGYITTYRDTEGRPTVYDLLKDVPQWVAPVGRLDQDTSGLLLLTNDNDFADRITDPEHKVPKTYLVKTSSVLSEEALERLRTGLELSDGPTRPAIVTRLRDSASSTFLEITITEGRNRQVRRMLEAVESRVRKLVRTAIGNVAIGDLAIGSYRALTPSELRSLGARYPEPRSRTDVETPRKKPGLKRTRRPRGSR
jgi:23S rRNA pseudouridine2605 synthase